MIRSSMIHYGDFADHFDFNFEMPDINSQNRIMQTFLVINFPKT